MKRVRQMTPRWAYIIIGFRIDSEAWATVRQIVPTDERAGPIPGSWSLVQPVALEYLFDSIGI